MNYGNLSNSHYPDMRTETEKRLERIERRLDEIMAALRASRPTTWPEDQKSQEES